MATIRDCIAHLQRLPPEDEFPVARMVRSTCGCQSWEGDFIIQEMVDRVLSKQATLDEFEIKIDWKDRRNG